MKKRQCAKISKLYRKASYAIAKKTASGKKAIV